MNSYVPGELPSESHAGGHPCVLMLQYLQNNGDKKFIVSRKFQLSFRCLCCPWMSKKRFYSWHRAFHLCYKSWTTLHKSYGIFSSPATKKSTKLMRRLGVFCNLSKWQVAILSCKLRKAKVIHVYIPKSSRTAAWNLEYLKWQHRMTSDDMRRRRRCSCSEWPPWRRCWSCRRRRCMSWVLSIVRVPPLQTVQFQILYHFLGSFLDHRWNNIGHVHQEWQLRRIGMQHVKGISIQP